ncbi:MAG: HIT domain-containing protein [Saprospiraceae bacterium]|jgi:histidine triad (HIT) family protein|nr:HIT domain-containing protein [Saprospiraceae bacterium]
MATLFTRIINGEIPCYKLAETDEFLAFLDIRPLKMGHALVIPKEEESYIFNLEDDKLAALMVFAKKVAIALKAEVSCTRIGVAVIGLEVPHTHIHLIPIDSVADINFKNPPLDLSPEVMGELASRIAAHL